MISKKRAVVLSIPHSGTHFCCYLLKLLGVDYRFNHFDKSGEGAIQKFVPTMPKGVQVVIPIRPYNDILESWKARKGDMSVLDYNLNSFFTWLPRIHDPIFIPIGPHVDQFTRDVTVLKLAYRFGVDTAKVDMRPQLTELIKTWRPVGSRFRDDNLIDDRKSLVVRNVLKPQDRMKRWLVSGKERE
jgi:hypothetical protein